MSGVQTESPHSAQRGQSCAVTLGDLVDRARRMAEAPGRSLIGITGAPGTGKSTVSMALLNALGDDAVLVGMDGFHLANEELVRLGRRERKGAPDTFDVEGYVNLLRRLRDQAEGTVYAPTFDRAHEVTVGSAIPVSAETPLVITEGNYLLMDEHGWGAVSECLDEVWFIDTPASTRVERLVARRQSFGDSLREAQFWVQRVDEANAVVVEATRERATLVVDLQADVHDPYGGSEMPTAQEISTPTPISAHRPPKES